MSELTVAIEAAKSAGVILLDHFKNSQLVAREKNGNPRDIVTQADIDSEREIISVIKRNFPTHSILAEESGMDVKESDSLWVVDPLDGTSNFFRGHRDFCVLIAYVQSGVTRIGVMYFPLTDELFVAERGKGAVKNDVPIHVSSESVISKLFAITQMSSKAENRELNMQIYTRLLLQVRSIQVLGSCTARALADIAEGIADFEFRAGFKYWDYAAGALLVEEARGKSTDLYGRPLTQTSESVLISNGTTHDALLRLVNVG